MRDWNGFFAFVRDRGGSLALADGRDFGITPSALRSRAEREAWPSHAPGTYRLPWLPAPQSAYVAGLSVVRAAVGDAVFGRATAAYALDMQTWWPREPHFVRRHSRRVPDIEFAKPWRSRTVLPGDVLQWNGFWMTNRLRTAVDMGGILTVKAERNLLMAGKQRGWFTYDAIQERNAQMGPHPGAATVRIALAEARSRKADSGFELDVQRAAEAYGLPPPVPLFPYLCPDGVVVHLDLAWPEPWVCLECDGRHHLGEQVFETDRVRWREITGDTPWDLGWITAKQYGNPRARAAVFADLEKRIARADPMRAPAPRYRCPPECVTCYG